MAITDLGNRLVVRPITTRGPKANTFIEIPTNGELLRALASHLNEAASRLEAPDATAAASHENLYRSAAKAHQVDGELEVDDNAKVSFGDDPGAYVECWRWIPAEEIEWQDCRCEDDCMQESDAGDLAPAQTTNR